LYLDDMKRLLRRDILTYALILSFLGFLGCNSPEEESKKWSRIEKLIGEKNVKPEKALIKAVKEAIDIFDFRDLAKHKLPPAHYGFLSSGSLNDRTLIANEESYSNYGIRVRRLINVEKIDLKTSILGTAMDLPIIFAPVGSLKAFHHEGGVAVARAAKNKIHEIFGRFPSVSLYSF